MSRAWWLLLVGLAAVCGACSPSKTTADAATTGALTTAAATTEAVAPSGPAAKVDLTGLWVVEGGRAEGYLDLRKDGTFILRAAPPKAIAPTIVLEGGYSLDQDAPEVSLHIAVKGTRAEVATHFITLEAPPINAIIKGTLVGTSLSLPLDLEDGPFSIPADESHVFVPGDERTIRRLRASWATRTADPNTIRTGPAPTPDRPEPGVPGLVAFKSVPPGAAVWVDGRDTGQRTPCEIVVDTVRVHHFELRKTGFASQLGRSDSGVFKPDDSGAPRFEMGAKLRSIKTPLRAKRPGGTAK